MESQGELCLIRGVVVVMKLHSTGQDRTGTASVRLSLRLLAAFNGWWTVEGGRGLRRTEGRTFVLYFVRVGLGGQSMGALGAALVG